jgi:hypothetical protein
MNKELIRTLVNKVILFLITCPVCKKIFFQVNNYGVENVIFPYHIFYPTGAECVMERYLKKKLCEGYRANNCIFKQNKSLFQHN